MKKIIAIIMIASMLMLLVGCGNMTIGFGNFEFNKIHISTRDFSGCLTINEWNEATTGVEVDTKEVGSLFLSEGTYIMVEDHCPICNR